MKCPNCGQISRNNRTTCALCGAPLKKERRGLWTAIAVLALALAGLALFLLRPRAAAEDPAPAPTDAPERAVTAPAPDPLWTDAAELWVTDTYTLALCRDGTLRLAGQSASPEFGLDLTEWTGIVQVVPQDRFVAALTADGRVRLTGEVYGYEAAARWTGVRSLTWSADTLFGLTEDGRVLAAGPNVSFDPSALTGVERLIPSYADTLAVTADGRVHVLPWLGLLNDAEGLTGVRDVAVNADCALYLMEDGTVRPADPYRRSAEANGWADPFADWTGVTELILGDWCALGLTGDGRVLSAACIPGEAAPDTSGWENVVQLAYDRERNAAYGVTADGRLLIACPWGPVSAGAESWENVAEVQVNWYYTVARTRDGRVLVAASEAAPAPFDTEDWTDVAQIRLSGRHLAAMTSDGRVYATGDNSAGQCG